MLVLFFSVFVCEHISVLRVLDEHGEVIKRWQLISSQRKPCGTHWRLTLLFTRALSLSHARTCGKSVACYFEPSCHQSLCNYRGTLGATGQPDYSRSCWGLTRKRRHRWKTSSAGWPTERCTGRLEDITRFQRSGGSWGENSWLHFCFCTTASAMLLWGRNRKCSKKYLNRTQMQDSHRCRQVFLNNVKLVVPLLLQLATL